MIDTYTHQYIETNGITLHVVTAGDPSDEPVLLMHGFPECWYCWHHQIDYLSQNGYYVIAPDQRGYNLSDKPQGVKNYHIDLLAKDMTGLIGAMGYEKMYVAAHDWGGVVAWWIATNYPHYLKKLMILNAPHPHSLTDFREFNLGQVFKSWYIFFFQIPHIPEWFTRRNNFFRESMVGSRSDSITEADYQIFEKAWSQPDALTSTINWYRASFRYLQGGKLPPDGSLDVQTRIVWGEDDKFLGKALAERAKRLCQDAELHFVPNATHWITHDEPAIVNQHMSEFFI